jgi:RNA polymerase sigma factor (sigma-70 family)
MSTDIHIESLSDLELVHQFKLTSNHLFFVQLYKRYTHLVYGVCLKYLKEKEISNDAVMDIFEKLLIDLRRHNIQNFKSWLYQVSKNHCLMQLRKKNGQHVGIETVKPTNEQIMEMPSVLHPNYMSKEDEEEKLIAAIANLNDEQKQCIDLFYLQNKSYNEIVVITNFTLNQVKSYIQNGKRNLKTILKKDNINISVSFIIWYLMQQ